MVEYISLVLALEKRLCQHLKRLLGHCLFPFRYFQSEVILGGCHVPFDAGDEDAQLVRHLLRHRDAGRFVHVSNRTPDCTELRCRLVDLEPHQSLAHLHALWDVVALANLAQVLHRGVPVHLHNVCFRCHVVADGHVRQSPLALDLEGAVVRLPVARRLNAIDGPFDVRAESGAFVAARGRLALEVRPVLGVVHRHLGTSGVGQEARLFVEGVDYEPDELVFIAAARAGGHEGALDLLGADPRVDGGRLDGWWRRGRAATALTAASSGGGPDYEEEDLECDGEHHDGGVASTGDGSEEVGGGVREEERPAKNSPSREICKKLWWQRIVPRGSSVPAKKSGVKMTPESALVLQQENFC